MIYPFDYLQFVLIISVSVSAVVVDLYSPYLIMAVSIVLYELCLICSYRCCLI